MSFEYQLYRQEILDFLSTLTIKFDPFAKQYAKYILKQYGIIIQSDYENPYYLNMCGLYSPYDELMYVTSIETEEKILFDINLKDNYPKTYALYVIPSEEHRTLCAKYPNQINLIKSILYPVKDLDTAINAPLLTVMNYDASILHSAEKDSILEAINIFIEYLAERWYVPDFEYEDLYPSAFWSILWSMLPAVCYEQRIRNLRTNRVHPTHIWEYLQSKGLTNYKSILTHEKSLFLYRNIVYLYNNKGKTSNLEILAEHLLDDLYVDLVGKNIFQEKKLKESEYLLVPEVISEKVKTRGHLKNNTFSKYETVEQMMYRMYNSDIEHDISSVNVEDTEDYLGLSSFNKLPTKFLEFLKYIIDSRFYNVLLRFLLQTMCYRYANNKLAYRIKTVYKATNTSLDMHIGEALALLNYCHHKSLGQDIVTIPTKMTFYGAYKIEKPSIPKYFNFLREPGKYPYNTVIPLDDILQRIGWTNQVFTTKEDFYTFTIDQFFAFTTDITSLDKNCDLKYHNAMGELYHKFLFAKELKDVNLTNYTYYDQLISSGEVYTQMFELIEEDVNKKDRYKELFSTLLYALLPMEDSRLTKFLGANKDDTDFYRLMVELFDEMTSYNVTFLDTDRTNIEYLFTSVLAFTEGNTKVQSCETINAAILDIDYFIKESNCTKIDITAQQETLTKSIDESSVTCIDQSFKTSDARPIENVRTVLSRGFTITYLDENPSWRI